LISLKESDEIYLMNVISGLLLSSEGNSKVVLVNKWKEECIFKIEF
jgi:hypothetical protein